MAVENTRLAGHTLPNEGRIYEYGRRVTDGPAVCSCGEVSKPLYSDYARKQWHREHKRKVRKTQ
jgi:hypothetical protein